MQLVFISSFAISKYLLRSLSDVLEWVGVGVGGGVVEVVEAGVGEGVEGVVGEVGGGMDQVVVVDVVVRKVAVHHGSFNLHHSRGHRGGGLLVSQTTGLNILELQVESFLSLGHVLSVSQVGGGDLRSLDIVVDWGQHGVVSSLGSLEGAHEVSPGLHHLSSVLQGQSS